MKFPTIYTVIALIVLLLLVPETAPATPHMGIYFSAPGCGDHLFAYPDPFIVFPVYIYLCDADYLVTAVEYQLETPTDPSHALFVVLDMMYPNRKVLTLGDPFMGHSITFWPPLDGFQGYNFICALKCLTVSPCANEGGYIEDYVLRIREHPDSGGLRGAYYPDHDLFSITSGLEAVLCESWYYHCMPYLAGPVVIDPFTVQAQFAFDADETSAEDTGHYSVYETWNPEGAVPVTSADLLADGRTIVLGLGSPLDQAIHDYSIRADNIREAGGSLHECPTVATFEFCPDLIAFDLSVVPDKLYEACAPYEIDFNFRNGGDYAAGPFRVSVGLRWHDGEQWIEDTLDTLRYGGLDPGDTIHVSTTCTMLPVVGLNAYFQVRVDDLGEVAECSEGNNGDEFFMLNHTPCILSIADLPDDTGGCVTMVFKKAYNDRSGPGDRVSGYEIHRRIDPPPGAPGAAGGNRETAGRDDGDDETPDRAEHPCCTGIAMEHWEPVGWIDAERLDHYTVTVPTVYDSSTAGIFWSVYLVRAVMPRTDPPDTIYYVTCPDSGYSVDNFPVAGMDETPASRFALYQNYPNPFNPATTIRYEIPAGAHVTLRIYNVNGGIVRTLIDARQERGVRRIDWDGRDEDGRCAASGVYFYFLRAGDYRDTKKMVLLR